MEKSSAAQPSFLLSCALGDCSLVLLCTQHLYCLCPCSVQGMNILVLATFSDPPGESGGRSVLLLDAQTCLRWYIMLPSHLPSPQPQSSSFSGSYPHLPQGSPAFKLSSFPLLSFSSRWVICFWGSCGGRVVWFFVSSSKSIISSLNPCFVIQLHGCPIDLLLWARNRKVKWNPGNEKHTFTN